MIADVKRSFPSPTARRLIRSYGLLIVIAVGFLLLALLVRETDETVPVESLKSPALVELRT